MGTKQQANVRTTPPYLTMIFEMLRHRDEILVMEKKGCFNKTELRLLSEVIAARAAGGHIISTQLAKRLGLTRSAVSQIINHLEERGVLMRVAAEDDKKIAYIEISESVLQAYQTEIAKCETTIGEIVNEFGEKKFEQMYQLYNEFMELIRQKIEQVQCLKCQK